MRNKKQFEAYKKQFAQINDDFWQHSNGFRIRKHDEDFFELILGNPLIENSQTFDAHPSFDSCIHTMISVIKFNNL